MESVFTDAEKRFVLAEMIKVSQMDVGTLVDFVKYHDIAPDWMEMQLPGGRNIRQCLRAAESMFEMHLQPPSVPSLKRKSFEDISDQLLKRQAFQSPIEAQEYSASRSFGSYGVPHSQHHYQPQQQVQMQTHPQHRTSASTLPQPQPQPSSQPVNIQPRPPPNGFVAAASTSNPTVHTTNPTGTVRKPTPTSRNPTGRKRGRPSKADREAWARANPAQPPGYATISPAPAPSSTPLQPSPSQLQAAYSPDHVGTSAYQVFSARPSSGHGASSTEDLPSTADEDQRYETRPRSIQSIIHLETNDTNARNDGHIKSESERNPPESLLQSGQRTPPGSSGLTPLEPPIQHTTTFKRHSDAPFAASTLREVIATTMEHGRTEGHPAVANQA